MTRNIILTLSYLGTGFAGWQKTPFKPSIQEMLENALQRILRETPSLQAASRTDAGVHAKGQVVNFFTDHPIELPLLKKALNGTLPKEISVLCIEEKSESFHPTLDCIKKEYRYFICNHFVQLPFHRNTSWHIPYALDVHQMRLGARILLGSQDFSAFCNERSSWNRNPVCHLEKICIQELASDRLCLSITGDHFLYKMVRNIVGTLIHVGRGKLCADDLLTILQKKERKNAGMTAPAHGLCLHQVYYANKEHPHETQ